MTPEHVEAVAGVGSWTWLADTGSVWWSAEAVRVLGGADGTVQVNASESDAPYLAAVLPADRPSVLAAARQGIRSCGAYAIDHRVLDSDGSVRTVHSRARTEFAADGSVTRILGTVQDVTEARRVEAELVRARDLFRGVLDAATEQSIIGLDATGAITVFNTGAQQMLGYTADEVIGTSPTRLHDPAEVRARACELGVPADFRAIVGRAHRGEPETRQWTYLTRDGRRLQARITVTAMLDAGGAITGFIKVGTDITAQVTAEEALRASDALFEAAFDKAMVGMFLADTEHRRVLRVNHSMEAVTGRARAELIGRGLGDLVHPDDRLHHESNVAALIGGGAVIQAAERRWVRPDATEVWVEASGSLVRYQDRDLILGVVQDISARKAAERRLSHLAVHDPVTGLANRTLLMDRLEHALAASHRSGAQVAVFYLDMDGFKTVNDTAGHQAGDDVLVTVARRLSSHVRPGDTVARFGGDEFVVLCPDLGDAFGSSSADMIAERLRQVLAEPYVCHDGAHALSASVGFAVSDGTDVPEELLHAADQAMYLAKDDGKNRVRRSGVDSPETLSRTARAARFATLETQMRAAVTRCEFLLHAQPVLDLRSGSVVAVEMLLRWQHPSRGLLLPAEFLDVAENSVLMGPIGQQVLEEACRIGATLTGAPDSAPPDVFVNISGRQLETGDLGNHVERALARSGLSPERLVLELTETTMPLLNGSTLAGIIALRERGVRLAIDDVGTGYSSLSRFTELPIDILKIDRSFISRIGQNATVDAVIKAILGIGRALGLEVVAEGVETGPQERHLERFGCRRVQGFRYSRPLPEAELAPFLRARPRTADPERPVRAAFSRLSH